MGRKILLADDSITIQKVVNLTFSDEGIDVVTVGNGELALRKLNDVRPDIVLADIYMPGRNGYEVCEYIKTNPQFSQIPVLLLVGAFEPFDQAEAARVKADGHLTKPFESRALIATVTRLLAQSAQEPSAAAAQPIAAAPQTQAPPVRQVLPPDSTTTRLSPDMRPQVSPPPRYEMPKVEPIRATAVPFEQLQPPIAFPPPTAGIFSPPPAANFEKPVGRTEPPTAPVPSGFGIFDTASKPPEPIKAAEPPQRTQPIDPFLFDTVSNAVPPGAEQVEDFELADDLVISDEQTAFYGDARKHVPDPVDFDDASLDSISPLELDEIETAIKNKAYQTTATEGTYDDITPLDLEPLEEGGYQSSAQEDILLEISSEPGYIEELPSIDAEDVLESSTDPRLKTVSMAVMEPISEPVKDTIEMAAVSVPETTEMSAIQHDDESPVGLEVESGLESVLDIETAAVAVQDEVKPVDEMVKTETADEAVSAPEPVAAVAEIGFDLITEPIDEIQADLSKSTTDEQPTGMVFDLDAGSPVPTPVRQAPQSTVKMSYEEAAGAFEEEAKRPVAEMTGEFTFELPEESSDLEAAETKEEFSFELPEEPPAVIEDLPAASAVASELILDEPLIEAPAEFSVETAAAPIEEAVAAPIEEAVEPVEMVAAPVEEAVSALTEEAVSAPLEVIIPEPVLPEPEPIPVEAAPEIASEPSVAPIEAEPIVADTAAALVAEAPPLPPVLPEAIEEVATPARAFSAHDEKAIATAPLPAHTMELPEPAAAAPAAITSIDQIPQHLMDEIVRRVIEKMSENVVREIAWDVVPDLAELLIKKRIDQKNL